MRCFGTAKAAAANGCGRFGIACFLTLLTGLNGCSPQGPGPDTTPIAGGGAWRSFASAPVPFHETAAAVQDGKLYYVGGRLPGGPIASLYRYDPPPIDGWTQLASHPGTPVDHMGAAFVNGILYAIGGTTEWPGPSVREVYAYDPAANQWSTRASMPRVLGAPGVGVVDGRIYCLGGLSGSQSVNWVFEYDPATDEWTDLTPVCPMPEPLDHFAAATVDGRIHVIGGRRVSIQSFQGQHYAFDPVARTWETRAAIPTPRAGFASAVLNGRILIMGGEGDDNSAGVFSENEEYDPLTDTWRTLSPMTAPRHSTQAGTIGNVVYVAGGAPRIARTFTNVNEGFSFDFE